jgi:hypothetical protein
MLALLLFLLLRRRVGGAALCLLRFVHGLFQKFRKHLAFALAAFHRLHPERLQIGLLFSAAQVNSTPVKPGGTRTLEVLKTAVA